MKITLLATQAKSLFAIVKAVPDIFTTLDAYRQYVFNADEKSHKVKISLERAACRLRFELDCIVQEPGSCVISQDVLRRAFAGLKENLQIYTSDHEVFVCGDSKVYSFPYYDFSADELVVKEVSEFTIFSLEVLKFIASAIKCKFQKNKTKLEVASGKVRVVDAYHFIEYGDDIGQEWYSIDADVMPILKVLFSEIAYVSYVVTGDSKWLRFSYKESELIIPVLDTRTVFPDDGKLFDFSVESIELNHVLKSVSPIVATNAKTMRPTPVKVEASDGQMTLTVSNNNFSGRTSKFTQQVSLSCEGTAEPIYMNLTYLKDIANLTNAGKVGFVVLEDHFLEVTSDKLKAKIGLLT